MIITGKRRVGIIGLREKGSPIRISEDILMKKVKWLGCLTTNSVIITSKTRIEITGLRKKVLTIRILEDILIKTQNCGAA